MKKRVLALDVGEKRIGVAVSDPLGLTAQSVETIANTSWTSSIERIAALARQYETDWLLCGLPLNMDGSVGPQAQSVMAFIDRLTQTHPFIIRYWDERMTTKSAHSVLLEANLSRKRQKQVVDRLAAAYILQSFLDSGVPFEPPAARFQYYRRGGVTSMEGNNMEYENIVELVDENDQVVRFSHLMTIEHEAERYILLVPVDPMEDVAEDEVVILRIEEDETGEDTYVNVEDEDVLEAVFQKYLQIAEADEEDDFFDDDGE